MQEQKLQSSFIERGLSFFVPFLGLAWAIRKKHRLFNLLAFCVNLLFCVGFILLIVKFFPFLFSRFQYFGHKPLCNLKEERAIHIGSFVFILCYRCTFIIIGGTFFFFIFYFKKVNIHFFYIIFSVLFILPCILDGMLQLFTAYESTNLLRAITGFFAGASIAYLLYLPFKKWNLFL